MSVWEAELTGRHCESPHVSIRLRVINNNEVLTRRSKLTNRRRDYYRAKLVRRYIVEFDKLTHYYQGYSSGTRLWHNHAKAVPDRRSPSPVFLNYRLHTSCYHR